MSSYIYRERERDREWDEPRSSSVSIKRYVIPSEEDRERDIVYRREDPVTGDRELVIRRSTEREEPVMVQRYEREVDYDTRPYDYRSERDYYDARGPLVVHPRESDYEVVHRSEVEREPAYYYHRRVREYDDDRRLRRELSPGDSISQTSRRRDDQDYSSDDSMVYIRKETREYDDHPHHRRHLAEGALVGIGAAELIRNRRKKEGDDVSSGLSRLGHDVGAGALGAVAVSAASRARDYYRNEAAPGTAGPPVPSDPETTPREEEEEEGGKRRERRRSRSRSRAPSEAYSDPAHDPAGLIEYGQHPVTGSIPAAHYYGRPASQQGYYSDASDRVARDAAGFRGRGRSRSRSRGGRYSTSSSDTDRDGHRRRSSRRRKHRSRSRELAEAALAATGVGYAAHKYKQSRDRKKEERERSKYDDDSYPSSYPSDLPYPPSPLPPTQPGEHPYYPNSNYFPPPPGSTPAPPAPAAPYNPADYPPPPGAVPPAQPYGYPPEPGPDRYAPRPRRADENVSAAWNSPPSAAQYPMHDGVEKPPSPLRTPRPRTPRDRARAASQPPQPKSVAFDLNAEERPIDPGYETDDSDTTIDSLTPHHHRDRHRSSDTSFAHRRRHSSSDPYFTPSKPQFQPSSSQAKIDRPGHSKDKGTTDLQEPDSDSTIDLPDRFDSHGRLLPERDNDPLVDGLEKLLRGINRVFV
ncbi:hypothetical protein KXW59_008505 [Aspergillus fumigatus]|nr:hypothetical protein KXW59_008505 [Aspergillus fumigatus]